jgi:hypothetical protein
VISIIKADNKWLIRRALCSSDQVTLDLLWTLLPNQELSGSSDQVRWRCTCCSRALSASIAWCQNCWKWNPIPHNSCTSALGVCQYPAWTLGTSRVAGTARDVYLLHKTRYGKTWCPSKTHGSVGVKLLSHVQRGLKLHVRYDAHKSEGISIMPYL